MRGGPSRCFHDRRDAGRQLLPALEPYRSLPNPLFIGLPRGGVIVAAELARVWRAPLEVIITRKLGVPGNPELAMGALAETGYRSWNRDVLRAYGITPEELEDELAHARGEIRRRIDRYRGGRPLPSVADRTVVLVDDGIATGATFYAALEALHAVQEGRAAHVVVAVPVATARVRQELSARVEGVAVLQAPETFDGIGQFYEDFSQVSDEEVLAALEEVRRSRGEGKADKGR